MTHTITKDDMRRVITLIFPRGWGGHTLDVYEDLISLFDYGVEYSLDDVFRPFVVDIPYAMALAPRRRYGLKEIAVFKDKVLAGGKVEKYADYLYPLFYVALVTKNGHLNASRDVAGRIFDDISDVFKPPRSGWEQNYKDLFGDNWRDWRFRWLKPETETPHHFTLTENELFESEEMYNDYLRAKMGMD